MNRISVLWKVAIVVSALLALGGLGAAGWSGYRWHQTAEGTSAVAVQERDDALKAARELAVTLQTVSSAQADESLDAWEAAATGDLLAALKRDREKHFDQLKKTPSTSTASVLDTALTRLDTSGGTATAITALDVTQTQLVNGKLTPLTVRQLRMQLTLKKTDAGWKAAGTGLIGT